jgi:hypothetical protein
MKPVSALLRLPSLHPTCSLHRVNQELGLLDTEISIPCMLELPPLVL